MHIRSSIKENTRSTKVTVSFQISSSKFNSTILGKKVTQISQEIGSQWKNLGQDQKSVVDC